MISIWMMTICDNSISKPLELIFGSCIENRKIPTKWKIAVVQAHKKGDKKTCKPTAQYLFFLLLEKYLR